jgi:hypothetical protein
MRISVARTGSTWASASAFGVRRRRHGARLDARLERAQRGLIDDARRIAPRLMMAHVAAQRRGAHLVSEPLDASSPRERQFPGQLAIELLPAGDSEPVQEEVRKRALGVACVDPCERIRSGAAGDARAFEQRDVRPAPCEAVGDARADDAAAGNHDPARRRREPWHARERETAEKTQQRTAIESGIRPAEAAHFEKMHVPSGW